VFVLYFGDQPSALDGTTFNDLDRPLTGISRLRYFATLNISETTRDRAIGLYSY